MRTLLIALVLLLLLSSSASTGMLTVCVPEPLLAIADITQWQYRTKVDGRPDRCWYVGRRMKPRNELTWAGPDPQSGPMPGPVVQPGEGSTAPPVLSPNFDQRWKGEVK